VQASEAGSPRFNVIAIVGHMCTLHVVNLNHYMYRHSQNFKSLIQ
jgi:hypothetical protein